MRTQENVVDALNFVADSVRKNLGVDVLTRFCITSETLFIETDSHHTAPFIQSLARTLVATHDRGKLAPLAGCAVEVTFAYGNTRVTRFSVADEPEAPTVRAIAMAGDYVVANGVVGRVAAVVFDEFRGTCGCFSLTCETERHAEHPLCVILPAGHPVPFATTAQSVRLSATLAHREALKDAPAWARDFERPKPAYVAAIGKIAADWVEGAKTLLTTADLIARAAEAMGVKPT